MRRKILPLLFLFSFLFSALPSFAAEKESAYDRVMRTGTFKCGYYPWPPYYVVDPNTKKISGLGKEVADAIGEILDLKVEYVQMAANK